jgi:hypothetical protein
MTMISRIDIKGVQGTPIRAVLVPAGELNPSSPTHVNDRAYVQFYDGQHSFTPDGQFITEYYVSTLVRAPLLTSREAPSNGLDLYGSEPCWKIDGPTMTLLVEWLKYHS